MALTTSKYWGPIPIIGAATPATIRSITIDHTKCGTADTTDFPLLFAGTYDGTGGEPNLRVVGSGGDVLNANGYDICFYSDAACTTMLDFERVFWTDSTGACEFWVEVPTVSFETDTVIYLRYGDSAITTDQQDATGTWNSNMKAVYHFNETSGTNINDSTAGGHDFTATRTQILNHAGGKVGNYGQFVRASADHATATNHADLRPAGNFTVTAWIKKDTLTGYMMVLASYYINGAFVAGFDDADKFRMAMNASELLGNTGQTDTSAWHHVAYVYNGSNVTFYFDGATDGTPAWSTALTYDAGNVPTIGAINYDGTYYHHFDGALDEIKLVGTNLTSSWILSEFNNQSSPSTFYTISAAL